MKNKEKNKGTQFFSYSLSTIKKFHSLFENKNFPYIISKKDMNYFSFNISIINIAKLRHLKYISKIGSKPKNKNKLKNIISLKDFYKKQISLYFIYLYEFYDIDKYYKLLFKFINNNFKNNSIFNNDDIFEIIHYNIIYNLIEMNNSENIIFNKISLFNISINYLTNIICNEFQKNQLNILYNILNSIHNLLINKCLFIFKNQNFHKIKTISLIKLNEINCSSYFIKNKNEEEVIKINNKYKEILNLIYGFNIDKNYNDNLLTNLRNAFIEIKGEKYSKEKIINSLSKINNEINYLNEIFNSEDDIIKNNNKDKYMPKRYFLFSKSNKSGINYNPKISLFSNNFTIIFSFKQYESEVNKLYPLFTLISDDEIIFGIYILNKKLTIYLQNLYKEYAKTEININKSYLITVEYNKKKNDLVELNINGEETKVINSGKIKSKNNTIVNIGYIMEKINKKADYKNYTNNYIGIIGPILFFNKILEEKDFISNIFELQGFYDLLININSNTFIYNDIYNQEINSLNKDIKEYFINISKKITENILFILSPISLINDFKISNFNSYNRYNNINFIENIFGNNDNKEKHYLNDIFSTLDTPLPYTGSIISQTQISSTFNFIKNDGFYIITLYFEYYYNILKMLVELNDEKENNNEDQSTIYFHINYSICPLLNLLYNIIKQCSNSIYLYKDAIDTMGFSIYKVFKILVNKTPLNSELLVNIRSFLLNINRIYIKAKDKDSKRVIINFINKILLMIFDKKFFNMKNSKEFNDYLNLFKIVLKNNEYLVDQNTLNLLLNFAFILDKKNFDKIEEYKQISKEYKNLLKIFIFQLNSIKLHCKYIQKVCNEQNNILIKYKLMKLYYIYNNIKYVYNQDNENDTKEKINSFFNLFKRNKNNNVYNVLLKEKLFKEYKKQFNILLKYSTSKDLDEKEKKCLELLKSIFIQLIYEQSVLIIPSKLDINYLEANISLSDIQIAFFKEDDIIFKKNNFNRQSVRINRREFYSFSIDNDIELVQDNDLEEKINSYINNRIKRRSEKHKSLEPINNREAIDYNITIKNNLENNEKFNNSNNKNDNVYGLFDELIINEEDNSLLNEVEISLYMFKSLFGCFYDSWNKDYKLKFIKDLNDNSYETFNMCFNDFNRFKQKLFFQFIQFLEIINNYNMYEKITRLIYSFIKQTINVYKTNQNEANSRRIFIHLFENKIIMKYLLNLCYDNKNQFFIKNNNLKTYVETSIINIINNILIFHPKPFIFSYIKNCIKNNKKYVVQIIKNISDYIINDLKNVNIERNNNITISFYYFNRIKFIISIKNSFQKYKLNSQNLLCENDYNLFKIIINLIEEYSKNNIVFDSKIYTYNPQSLVYIYDKNKVEKFNEEEKKKDKNYIKSIQLNDTKIINSEGLFINLVELSLHIIYLLWTVKGEFSNFVTRMNIKEFCTKISNIFIIKDHLIGYYIDLENEFFSYSQPKKHINMIRDLPKEISENMANSQIIRSQYIKFIIKNPFIKDNRIMSVVVFLLFMKYKSMILSYEYNQNSFNLDKKENFQPKVNDIFGNFIQKAMGDAIDIYKYISKIKEDEKLKLFYAKEFKSNKNNWMKTIYQNYYKYLLETIKKKKIVRVLDALINDIERKYMKELEEEENNNNNNLVEGKNIENDNIQKKNEDLYKVNNIYENDQKNNNNNEDKNDNNEFVDMFTIIEKTPMENNDNIIDNNNDKNENDNEYNNVEYINSNYLIDAKYQILCTKRDLILKNLAYFFYEDYFIDKNFLNLRKQFMSLFPPEQKKNNYNTLQKQMTIKFPSTMKNYSNTELYYPKIFFRPDKHFFKNNYFEIGHKYFQGRYIEIKKPNFEYGHGLLNQTNFNLFEFNNKENEEENENENNIKMEYKNYEIIENTQNFETELLCSNNNTQGNIVFKDKYIVYQTNTNFDFNKYKKEMKYILSSKVEEISQVKKQIIIPYKSIKQIIKRKFIFFEQALEIYLNNGKSYFFNLYTEEICQLFFDKIERIKKNENNNYNFEIIKEPYDYFLKKKYTSNWLDKKISTLEYLLKINKFSGRTYNDLTQYLVLPWTLKDYLDINNKIYYRDFGLAMSIQEKECLDIIKEYYDLDNEQNKSHFKCHYSNSSYVTIYLFRINPFTNNQIKLQTGKFDAPHRQVNCLQDLCNIFKEHKETCELIPEYYYLVESFLNVNYNFYGFLNKKEKDIVNNLKLTKDFDTLLELFLFHQNFINSDEVSSNVNKWIDNIYGENQLTTKKNIVNSYPFECYEQNIKKIVENSIKELENKIKKDDNKNINMEKEIDNVRSIFLMTYLMGQCPGQLFNKTHPQYSGKSSKINYNKFFMKNEVKTLSYNELLYMNESNGNSDNNDSNYFYIVANRDILIFNKQMKSIINLNINSIQKIYLIYDYDSFLVKEKDNNINKDNNYINTKSYCKQYYYKRLIFDIEDCKFFFIGGYFDSSYKIYLNKKDKDKNKSSYYNYITNSIITCMKYMKNTNIYFTGHIDGIIIKWKYTLFDKGKDIKCKKVSSILGHREAISILEIHDKLELLLSASDKEGLIFIRKIYDYELLGIIRYNNLNKEIMDITIDKEYFVVTYNYKRIINNIIQKIETYSVNGVKLAKIEISKDENNNEGNINDFITFPVTIQQNNDNLFMFSKNSINFMKITNKNKIELMTMDENILKTLNKGESKEALNLIKSDFIDSFNDKLKNNIVISYIYDFNSHLLFCLFNNGNVYRINLFPKALLEKNNLIQN